MKLKRDEVIKILCKKLIFHYGKGQYQSDEFSDLGVDSVTMIKYQMFLEKRFKIKTTVADIIKGRLDTVSKMADLVIERMK